MSFFSRIYNFFRSRDKPKDGGSNSGNNNRSRGNMRNAVEYTIGDMELASNEDIFAAVTRISNTFATVPCHLYKNREIQKDHPMEWLIAHEPGPAWTPYSFQQTQEAFRNTTGNMYALKVPKPGGGVDRLDLIDPARVEPMYDTDTGELWYRLWWERGELIVHNMDIIHTRHVSANGYKGIPNLDVLRDTLDYDARIKTFSLSQLESGIHSPISMEVPSEVSDDKKKSLVKAFLDAYKESGGGLIVLDAGAKATRLAGSPIDAKVFEVERITKNSVATVYNLPPHMLGDYTESSFQTNEQSMLEFISLTMLPIFTMYAQELNKKLLTREERLDGFTFMFDSDVLLLADTESRSKFNMNAVRSGAKMPNEIRRASGDPDVPGGNRLFFSRDLVPMEAMDLLAEAYIKSLIGGN